MVLLFTLPLFTIVGGIQECENNITNQSGFPESEVIYHLSFYNDKDYIVNYEAQLVNSIWDSTLIPEKIAEVWPNEEVIFQIIVVIPSQPSEDFCYTIIQINESPYLYNDHKYDIPIINRYDTNLSIPLKTDLTYNEINEDLHLIIFNNFFLFSIIPVFIVSSAYIWHGRKYFFFSTLYMNIPKEKIFDSQKREMISSYLNENNGSNLSQISNGTGIHLQTLRHHMKLFEQSEIVLRKDKKYFLKRPGSNVFDTEILSPVLQRLFEIIQDKNGITHSELIEVTNRSKPWIGNRIHELLQLDLIEIEERGRYKYIHPKGLPKKDIHVLSEETDTPINIHQNISNNT